MNNKLNLNTAEDFNYGSVYGILGNSSVNKDIDLKHSRSETKLGIYKPTVSANTVQYSTGLGASEQPQYPIELTRSHQEPTERHETPPVPPETTGSQQP